jgi:DNA-directed RNA polymerase
MVKRIKVKNQEEFEEMLQNKDIKISKAIVEIALKNLNSKKRFIPILEIYLEEEEQIFDITLDRKDMLQTLKQNLEIHELHEDYEGCARIALAIKEIESKSKK